MKTNNQKYIEKIEKEIKIYKKFQKTQITERKEITNYFINGLERAKEIFITLNPPESIQEPKLDITIYESDTIQVKLQKTLQMFVEFRKQIKKPIKEASKKMFIRKLDNLSGNDPYIMIEILENSIANGWQGIFPVEKGRKVKQVFGE